MPRKITQRHDAVLFKVKKLIESGSKKDWELHIDETPPGPNRLRPDIYMKSPDGKQIILADVTVPYEHGVEAMQRAWDRKVEKYTDSFAHLKVGGASLSVLQLFVGTLGTWWKPTSKSLEQLGIEKGVIRRAIPEICSTVLEYSKNAYWNHIYGNEYTDIPQKFGDRKPDSTSWKRKRS
ncbi:hypothetical protein B9Z55_005112 [Caenorhabditis nigoni]|uniref:Reverse transcriptase domain-containing protein n=1 Tax=Caenorhabditis nigoni TaxID=1611254 RepID=A0A2G5UZH1_9PELO|nr:hypothetical protein B9Z55_005112 [Caenorhabditis nigoni]